MILKKYAKKVIYINKSWYLFILESVIRFDLAILITAYEKLTYLKASTNIRQLGHKQLKHTSYTHINHFIKLVDGIKLDCIYLLENNNILEDDQYDEALFGFWIK